MIERVIHMLISFVGLGVIYVGTQNAEHWVSSTILVLVNLMAGLALVVCGGAWIVYLNNKLIEHKQAPIRLSGTSKFIVVWDLIVGFGAAAILYMNSHVLTSLNMLFAQLVVASLIVKYTKKPVKHSSKTEKKCTSKASRLKAMLSDRDPLI